MPGWLFDKGDFYHDPDARINLAALQRNLETVQQLGIISRPVDPAKYLDESFVLEAIKRLDASSR